MTAKRRPPVRGVEAFTLIEVMTVIIVMGVIGAGAMGVVSGLAGIYAESVRDSGLNAETWVAAQRMGAELRNAAPLGGGNSEGVTLPARGASGSTLSFTRPSAAQCSICVDKSVSVTFYFTPADGKLWRSTAAAPDKLLADKVTVFTVTASDDPVSLRFYTITLTRTINTTGDKSASATMSVVVYPTATLNPARVQVVM